MDTPRETADQPHASPPEYWPGLSALRGLAMLLGITLHASVAYLPTQMDGLIWVVTESPAFICDLMFWWVHAWRLPLFFFLSGFFAKLTMDRRGLREFTKHRIRRLLIPYVVAVYTICPAVYLIFSGGWYLTGQCTLEQMLPYVPFPSELQSQIFGPAHLWFLQDLLIMSGMYLYVVYAFTGGTPLAKAAEWTTPVPWWIPMVLAIPSGLLLWGDLSPVIAINNTFFVDPARLLYYSLFFIGGLASCRNRSWFVLAVGFPRIHLLLSLPFSVLYMWLLRSGTIDIESLHGRLIFGLTTGLVAWLTVYGLMGYFLYCWRSDNAVVRYVADSSYWIYLCHLPIVAAMHLSLHWLELPAVMKFLITAAATLVIGFVSYQGLVRYTIIGRYLHGVRRKQGTEPLENAATLTAQAND